MNLVSCAVEVKQMPSDIVLSDQKSLVDLEQTTFDLISVPSDTSYRRMCIYILMQTVQQYPNTGESMLCHIISTRFGYHSSFVRACLRAASNYNGIYTLRAWSNRMMRKSSERFYVTHKNFDAYKDYLHSLHPEFCNPEFCKLNVVWPQLEKR